MREPQRAAQPEVYVVRTGALISAPSVVQSYRPLAALRGSEAVDGPPSRESSATPSPAASMVIGWKVYSFVRRTNTTEATLDLGDFTQTLVRRKLLSNDRYLSGIESGTEVFRGSGRLDTTSYSVDIG